MNRIQLLKYYFLVFGLLNIFIISFTVPLLFGDMLLWHPRNFPDELMISVIYLAVGIMMAYSVRNPLAHKSFLDFVIIANILHAIVMVIYAENFFHLLFDVMPIGLMGVLPLLFYPWGLNRFLRYRY